MIPTLLEFSTDKIQEKQADGTLEVTCRPLSVYARLDDKIIQAATSRYLTQYFDRYLHENILSYRKVRCSQDQPAHVPDFNDGAKIILDYRKAHLLDTLYAADCDIKKFYDIIPHPVVRQCFQRLSHYDQILGLEIAVCAKNSCIFCSSPATMMISSSCMMRLGSGLV